MNFSVDAADARRDAEIGRLAAEGLSTSAIAAEVGCSEVTAWELVADVAASAENRRGAGTGCGSTAEAERRDCSDSPRPQQAFARARFADH